MTVPLSADDVQHDNLSLQATAKPAVQRSFEQELGSFGVSLIIIGILHLLLTDVLDPTWGVVLIVLGLLNLVLRYRFMFILNGLAIFLVGLMNIFGAPFGFWTLFGIMQLVWGVQEMGKFGQ